jgi:hypothetical protein
MDLLKMMRANRAAAGVTLDPTPRQSEGKKPSKTDRAKEIPPGTRMMRKFIIEEKPGKKVVKEHLEAMIARACESSSDEED